MKIFPNKLLTDGWWLTNKYKKATPSHFHQTYQYKLNNVERLLQIGFLTFDQNKNNRREKQAHETKCTHCGR